MIIHNNKNNKKINVDHHLTCRLPPLVKRGRIFLLMLLILLQLLLLLILLLLLLLSLSMLLLLLRSICIIVLFSLTA